MLNSLNGWSAPLFPSSLSLRQWECIAKQSDMPYFTYQSLLPCLLSKSKKELNRGFSRQIINQFHHPPGMRCQKKPPNNTNNWCWQKMRGECQSNSGGYLLHLGEFWQTWEQVRGLNSTLLIDTRYLFWRRKLNFLLISHWLPLSLYSSVDLVMRGEGAQNFPNTLGEIGRNSLCHNLLWGVYGLKPLPYTPVTPFPLRLKSFSKHQTRDYLLISF